MAHPTNNTTTTVDARDALGYPEHLWAGSGAETTLLNTTLPHAFNVHQTVLIWYCRDKRWHEGKIIRFRSLGLCEVEFCAGGPRIRNWYQLSDGLIRPDTPSVREGLKTQGVVIVTKTRPL